MHLSVDSTGLKLCGAGEWLVEKHGTKTRRSWNKLHLGTGRVVAATPTDREVDDASQVGSLLDRVTGSVACITGDGAYDRDSVRDSVYAEVAERHPEADVVVPPRSTAVPSEAAETAPTRRDRHPQHIAEHGRMAWQKASEYTKRARAETAISRYKRVIGDGLRSHTVRRRVTEVSVAIHALDRMLEFGRP